MAHSKKIVLWLSLLLVAAIALALPQGRYPLDLCSLGQILVQHYSGLSLSPEEQRCLFIFQELRLPRICAALLIGACLAASGAVYQNMFHNPLVSPGILGVQQGAAFGAAVGIVIFSSLSLTQVFSFAGGALGVGLSFCFAALYPQARFLALIIGGLVSGSFFMALTSLLEYVADPNQQLPELVFWLMGTLSHARSDQLLCVAPVMLAGLLYICLNGKAVNVLAMGDDEAQALGIDSTKLKLQLIAVATLICSLTVVLAGIINWVGLVIPHIMRFICGPDNRWGLPAAALGGAFFVLVTDTLVRTVWTVELPLGIATSILSLPLFALSLWYDWKRR